MHRILMGLGLVATVAACGHEPAPRTTTVAAVTGEFTPVHDTVITAELEAAGIAEPLQRAVLSTKLMATVNEVLVREGDRVAAGQPLVRLDAREIDAKSGQVAAGVAGAEAMAQDARTQTERIRGLFADSAATRAQLDAAEAGLARAEAGLAQARAAARELEAVGGYAVVRAQFAGIVTRRFVDPGAFAAPGAPLVEVQDASRLRVSASVAPDAVHGLRRGAAIEARIEGERVAASVEGAVPAGAGAVYTVNALVDNRAGRFLPGTAATLLVPLGQRRAVLVPTGAIVREGDLTGVRVQVGDASDLRWVRLGRELGERVEVLSGLAAGDRVQVRRAEEGRS